MSGSSPRRRGTHPVLECPIPIDRFIPAQAGNTRARGTPKHSSPVHPRAGGEHRSVERHCFRDIGSSPRRRGTLRPLWEQLSLLRFIPAQAGNTPKIKILSIWSPVHPRAGGEHLRVQSQSDPRTGSSPRRRGTPSNRDLLRLNRRFIPAQAGNTRQRHSRPPRLSVHPRAGGEHKLRCIARNACYGSSPRRRGTLRSPCGAGWRCRFIPAQAGNTMLASRRETV